MTTSVQPAVTLTWGEWVFERVNNCLASDLALNAIRLTNSLTSGSGMKAVCLLSLNLITEEYLNTWVVTAAKVNKTLSVFFPVNILLFPSVLMIPFIIQKGIDLGSFLYSNWDKWEQDYSDFSLNSFRLFLQSNIIPCFYECISKLFITEASKWAVLLQGILVIHYVASASIKIFSEMYKWDQKIIVEGVERINDRIEIKGEKDKQRAYFNLYLMKRVEDFIHHSANKDSSETLKELENFLIEELPYHQFGGMIRKTQLAIEENFREIVKNAEEEKKTDLQKKLNLVKGYLTYVESIAAKAKNMSTFLEKLEEIQQRWLENFCSMHNFLKKLDPSHKELSKEEIKGFVEMIGTVIRNSLGIQEEVDVLERKQRHAAGEDARTVITTTPAPTPVKPPRIPHTPQTVSRAAAASDSGSRDHEEVHIEVQAHLAVKASLESLKIEAIAMPTVPVQQISDEGAPDLAQPYHLSQAQDLQENVKSCLKELQKEIYSSSFSLWDIPLAFSRSLEGLYLLKNIKLPGFMDVAQTMVINAAILTLQLMHNLWQGIKRIEK